MRNDDELSPTETHQVRTIRRLADEFVTYIEHLGKTRETSLAVTNMQQAAMWAERHVKAR